MSQDFFSDVLPRLVRQIETRLDEYARFSTSCPAQLREAVRYSLLAGGKRLRPALVLLACEACGGNPDAALPAACAIEMVHTYSLIHDDLPAMDDDDLRRGRPTNHVVYGEATAILAGDGLLTFAFEVLARDLQPASVAAACCADLASAAGVIGMVGGQQADLEAEAPAATDPTRFSPAELLEKLEAIHRRKTGRLLCSALTMGGCIAGASAARLSQLRRYGECVGLAFQIIDDLLDLTSTPEQLGKNVKKDAGLGKLTYPGLLGEAASRERAEGLIREAITTLADFGPARKHLETVAHYVLERKQ